VERNELRQLAFLVSTVAHSVLGTCDRLRVACGIIKDKRLRGLGFNGSVNGLPHCDDVGHLMEDGHCVATVHAERNATINTEREYLQGAQAIVTATPCINCIKDLLQSGVARVDFYGTYSNSLAASKVSKMASEKGVPLEQHEVDWAEVFQELFDALARDGGVLKNAGYRLKVVKENSE
jgi:dCMP deaminase